MNIVAKSDGNRWAPLPYARRLFESVGKLQQLHLLAVSPDDLDAYWQPFGGEAARHGHRWMFGE